jgi:hypothetical protein
MDGCTHTPRVRCSKARSEGFVCPESCTARLPCGHECPSKCGRCVAHNQAARDRVGAGVQAPFPVCPRVSGGSFRFSLSLVVTHEHDKRCLWFLQVCGTKLLCGHPCALPCHKGQEGSACDCRQACAVACSHSSCSRACGEVCRVCFNLLMGTSSRRASAPPVC